MLSSTMDVLLAVGKHRRFALAAKQVGVSPSTISRTVRDAESTLGVRLFQRTTRSVVPTVDGQRFLARLAMIAADMDASIAELQDRAQAMTGLVRLSCSVAFGQVVVMPALHQVQLENPGLSVQLTTTNRRVDLLADGIDLAFRHGALTDDQGQDVARRVCGVRYGLYSRPGFWSEPTLAGLNDQPTLTFDAAMFRDSWVLCSKDGSEQANVVLRPRLRSAGALPLCSACEAGLGVAVLPDWVAQPRVSTGALERVLVDYQVTAPTPVVWAVTPGPRRRQLTTRVQAVISAVSEQLMAIS